jgi:4-amino-4-deoxy-L-arabinose transferase-like glycosyltransferase
MQKLNPILDKYGIYLILLIAFLYRIFLHTGFVFSDDAYYNYLAFTFYKGAFANDFIGYPVVLLRINIYILTSLAFLLFGTTEFAISFFPMLFSLANILLAYRFAKLITKSKKYALIAAYLMAFFPTDVVFATINFTDAPATFFINFGLFLLYKAYINRSMLMSIYSGISLALSIQFKVNIVFIVILLVIVFLYLLINKTHHYRYTIIALGFVLLNFSIESLVYYFINNDLLYRLHQTHLNYQYSKNDFFILGSFRGYGGESDYWMEVLKRVFIYNPKSIFLRRFYLFLPLIALYQSWVSLRKKEFILIIFWFCGLFLLYIGFTISLKSYQPHILRLSWYIFPLFMPMILLSSKFIILLRNSFKVFLLITYFLASILMCQAYQKYFRLDELNQFKTFIHQNPTKTIFTDHYTKYGIDLYDNFYEPSRTKRINLDKFSWNLVNKEDLIIRNKTHMNELVSQGHRFPALDDYLISNCKLIAKMGHFEVYKIINLN